MKEDGELETSPGSSSILGSHAVLGMGGIAGLGGGGGGIGGGPAGNSGNFLMQFSSPFAAITALAVAACLLIMLVFVTIFAVLQVI